MSSHLSRPITVAEASRSVASPISFARAALAHMVAQPCRLHKLRIDLDAYGNGEALYRFSVSDHVFHFFVMSQELPEEQKLDRNFAASWDVMGAFCEGAWTAERENYLRRQIPLQRAGRADYDTLIYARGNRSGRLFNEVVEALAQGRQPKANRLAKVGYILRTTAFIGNGQLGTRPLAAFAPDHPLRAPYHAQMCSGFLLREFVFDLVDAMAAARSPAAARLALPLRRFLGLGNSAATGLVPFLTTHARLIGAWIAAERKALEELLARAPSPESISRLRLLLMRAVQHLEEGARTDDGVFSPDADLAASLRRVLQNLPAGAPDWKHFRERALSFDREEAAAVFDALLLELAPDIVADHARRTHIDETLPVRPGSTTRSLLALVRSNYGWALEAGKRTGANRYFWYRSASAPRDLRRGLRGRVPEIEFETTMDLVPRLTALAEELEGALDQPLADFLLARPELRAVAARVQALSGLSEGELEINFCSADFSPFAPIRQVLTLFGMDKIEAAFPKSVRGTFLQGAPIAEDLERDEEVQEENSCWPYPLIPTFTEIERSAPLPRFEAQHFDPPSSPAASECADRTTVAFIEMERAFAGLLQAHGLALGLAVPAGIIAARAVAARPVDLGALVDELSSPDAQLGSRPTLEVGGVEAPSALVLADGAHPLAVLPAALDIACDRARRHKIGSAVVQDLGPSLLTAQLCAALCPDAPVLIFLKSNLSVRLISAAGAGPVPPEAQTLLDRHLEICGARQDASYALIMTAERVACDAFGDELSGVVDAHLKAGRGLFKHALQHGVVLSREHLSMLNREADRMLVPPEIEVLLRDEEIDPLKMF